MYFAVKAILADPAAEKFTFDEKAIHDGERIEVGDEVYIFASEGNGLCAKGEVTAAKSAEDDHMSIEVKRTAKARFPLGRDELKSHTDSQEEGAEAELAQRLYGQESNKISGISELTAAFLDGFF